MKQKTIKDDEKVWEDLFREAQQGYERNHSNSEKVDAKAVQFITLTTAVLLLFVQFIDFPNGCFLQMYYVSTVLLLFASLLLLILAYEPASYESIDTNKLLQKFEKNGFPTRVHLLQSITGEMAANTTSIKKKIQTKSVLMKWSTRLLITSLFIIFILKMAQGA